MTAGLSLMMAGSDTGGRECLVCLSGLLQLLTLLCIDPSARKKPPKEIIKKNKFKASPSF